jgi:uncharacterized protein (UPF0276 family)
MRRVTALPTLSVGLGYRPQFRAELFENRPCVDFLEIIADQYFDAPPEKLAELDLLRAHFPLVPHGLDLSLGSVDGLDEVHVDKFARLIERIDPPWWSEHLCFTRAGGVAIGHLAALPLTRAALDTVERNVERLRRKIEAPLILENVTTVVAVPGAEMDSAEFLSRALERTGCGWLCDVANLHADAVNHGVDLEAGFPRWPWERVVQIHFAGGRWRGDVLIDSHDSPTAEAVWALFERVAAVAPVKAAILERDEKIPLFTELLDELERARRILAAAPPRVDAPPIADAEREGRNAVGMSPPTPNDLMATQNTLARLFTDGGFRETYFDHAGETSASKDLAALDRESVALFAESLANKRVADGRKTLPWTAKALGNDFARLLRPALGGPAPPRRHADDAATVVARMEKDPTVPTWILDLARYELGFVAAATPGLVCTAKRLRWPPARLVLRRKGAIPAPSNPVSPSGSAGRTAP